MFVRHTFQVADHRFTLESPKGFLSEKELLPYASFQTDFSSYDNNKLFTLRLLEKPDSITDSESKFLHLDGENGSMHISTGAHGGMTIKLTTPNNHDCSRLHISKDFHNAKAWMGGSEREQRFALDSALMLMYAFASAPYKTLLIHASAIEYDGRAFLFLGKSGTGKSTHSRFWLNHIPGATLLNDDNPIIRIIEGKIYAYGSPWSGKTPCYKNHRIPLAGIVRLQQAMKNRITSLSGLKAYAALLPSCSCMKWDHNMSEAIHSTISKVIDSIPVYSLDCLPDKEAAFLCHENLTAENQTGTHGPCILKSEGND